MAKHTVKAKARYQLRGDTAAALAEVNPTPRSKEPVLVLDETGTAVAFKIGDGITPYAELPLHSFDADFNERINANKDRLDEQEQSLLSLSDTDYDFHIRLEAVEAQLGTVQTALDGILAIQEALIGGDAE